MPFVRDDLSFIVDIEEDASEVIRQVKEFTKNSKNLGRKINDCFYLFYS